MCSVQIRMNAETIKQTVVTADAPPTFEISTHVALLEAASTVFLPRCSLPAARRPCPGLTTTTKRSWRTRAGAVEGGLNGHTLEFLEKFLVILMGSQAGSSNWGRASAFQVWGQLRGPGCFRPAILLCWRTLIRSMSRLLYMTLGVLFINFPGCL